MQSLRVRGTKKARLISRPVGLSCINPGNDLLSHRAAPAVPSALEGLTAVFGMGTGVTPPLESPGSFEYLARPLLPLNFRVASAGTVLQLHSAKTGPALSKFKGQAARPISTR